MLLHIHKAIATVLQQILTQSAGCCLPRTMGQTIYVGLAVSAAQPDEDLLVNTSVFKHVSIDGTVDQSGPLEKVLDIGMPANSEEEMYVTVEDSEGNSALVVNPEGTIATRASNWTSWQVALSEVADKGVDLTKVQKLKIGLQDCLLIV